MELLFPAWCSCVHWMEMALVALLLVVRAVVVMVEVLVVVLVGEVVEVAKTAGSVLPSP